MSHELQGVDNMSKDTSGWSFGSTDIFTSIGFSSEDCKILNTKADDFIRAILKISPPNSIEQLDEAQTSASSSAPLYIPGKRYHLNLTATAKNTLTAATAFVANAYILHTLRLLDLAAFFSSTGIQALIAQITKLTDRQRLILDAICDLKRRNGSPLYWPTQEQVASKLHMTPTEIQNELTPIQGKVVQYDTENKTWRIIL